MIGAAILERGLLTADLREANEKKWQVLSEFQRIIKQAARDPEGFKKSPEYVAKEFRERITKLRASGAHEEADSMEIVASNYADDYAEEHGETVAARFLASVAGKPTLRDHLRDWNATGARPSTQRMRRQALDALLDHIGSPSALPEEITPQVALAFADKMLKDGLAANTRRNRISLLTALWKYMTSRLAVPTGATPFDVVRIEQPQHRGNRDAERRAFEPGELVALLTGNAQTAVWETQRVLQEALVVAIYTGFRQHEVFDLTAADLSGPEEGEVDALWVRVASGKTSSSRRTIPVLSAAARAILARRSAACADSAGFVFPEYGGRAESFSSRFSDYKEVVLPDAPVDFHSARRSALSRLEQAGADPLATMRFAGHKPSGMTFGLYSRAAGRPALLAVAGALRYPLDIELAAGKLAQS